MEIEKRKWDKKAAKFLAGTSNWTFRGSYDDTFTRLDMLKPVHAFFDKIGSDANILDYGCGNGWMTMLLATRARRVSAFDLSMQQIRVLQRYVKENRFSNIFYSVANGSQIPFTDGSFHYVFGNAILHHLALDQCLSEVARVLKPGGRAAFCEPFDESHIKNFLRSTKFHFSEKKPGSHRPISYPDKVIFRRYFSKVEFIRRSQTGYRFSLGMKMDDLSKRYSTLIGQESYLTILLEK